MNDLIAKIVGLGYEFFGVILPGVIGLLFLVLTWGAAGPSISFITNGGVPELDSFVRTVTRDSIDHSHVVISLAVAVYLLGQVLHNVGSLRQPESSSCGAACRLAKGLAFNIKPPAEKYASELDPFFEKLKSDFGVESWTQFYRVARPYLVRSLSASSLLATYQNKYTLHRSIIIASVGWFWLSTFALVSAAVSIYLHDGAPQPQWGSLVLFIVFALALYVSFYRSYRYYWLNFGNAVLSECYSLICGPKIKEG